MRCASRKQMEVADWDTALPFRAADMDRGFERGQRDVHVGRIGRDAMFARSQNSQAAIDSRDRCTTGSWIALVTRHRRVAEIHATRSLRKIAAGGRHVAKL